MADEQTISSEEASENVRKMLDEVVCGCKTYTIYRDTEHQDPLAVVLPYDEWKEMKDLVDFLAEEYVALVNDRAEDDPPCTVEELQEKYDEVKSSRDAK